MMDAETIILTAVAFGFGSGVVGIYYAVRLIILLVKCRPFWRSER